MKGPPIGPRRGKGGMALVGALIIVALLSFAGTVMALAVESSLNGVRQVSQDDSVKYAAESAVARAIGAALQSSASCPSPGGLVNGQAITVITCAEPLKSLDASTLVQFGVAAGTLPAGQCVTSLGLDVDFDSGQAGWFWLVLGVRQSGGPMRIQVSVDANPTCSGSTPCSTISAPGPSYVACRASGDSVYLHIRNQGDPVFVGSYVIRAARTGGTDTITTVIGAAGNEVDEADLLIPQAGAPIRALWHTVLP